MTLQEAIEQVEAFFQYDLTNEEAIALRLGIVALEKQIPKKPIFYAHNYYCEECGNLVGNNEFHWQRFLYCDRCGTKIEWEEGGTSD